MRSWIRKSSAAQKLQDILNSCEFSYGEIEVLQPVVMQALRKKFVNHVAMHIGQPAADAIVVER